MADVDFFRFKLSYLKGMEMIMGFFEIHKQIEQDLAFLSDWAMFHLGMDH